ncbi:MULTISPECIES: hypothetical protein [unclassified Asaia]|nr:hypothetical protein [Asaia sp. W19]
MAKIIAILVGAMALTACNGIDHAACPNDPTASSYQITSAKSVLHTCN